MYSHLNYIRSNIFVNKKTKNIKIFITWKNKKHKKIGVEMRVKNYKSYKKGMGIIVNIPGDHHNGVPCTRPGIVLDSNPGYVVVQLFSSRSNPDDLASFAINNKTQYIRGIYLKNVLLTQIKGIWWDKKNKKNIALDTKGKIMKIIEQYPHKAVQ